MKNHQQGYIRLLLSIHFLTESNLLILQKILHCDDYKPLLLLKNTPSHLLQRYDVKNLLLNDLQYCLNNSCLNPSKFFLRYTKYKNTEIQDIQFHINLKHGAEH